MSNSIQIQLFQDIVTTKNMDAEATQLVKEVNNGLRVGNLNMVKAALAGKHCG
jgi:hypothetical protein